MHISVHVFRWIYCFVINPNRLLVSDNNMITAVERYKRENEFHNFISMLSFLTDGFFATYKRRPRLISKRSSRYQISKQNEHAYMVWYRYVMHVSIIIDIVSDVFEAIFQNRWKNNTVKKRLTNSYYWSGKLCTNHVGKFANLWFIRITY